jgi:hypothetical protein
MGVICLGSKERLRQRSWPFRASRNMGVIFLEKKKSRCGDVVGRSELPEVWGSFVWEAKSACGNVVGRSGLPEIWGSFFWRKKKAVAAT